MIDADLVLRNADELFTCPGPSPRRGAAQARAGGILRGAVAALDGRIVFAGSTAECDQRVRVVEATGGGSKQAVVDLQGHTIVPGFVDPHTHVVYAGDRRAELRQRLAGATYADIAAAGGGILATVAATRAASESELAEQSRLRLDEMLRAGTTTCEIKSGYGLTVEDELEMLRVIRRLGREQPIDVVATFMGAHEVPPEHRATRADYVRLVIDEMIPRVAAEGLAECCDVFCETGVFTVAESREILRAGRAHGLRPRVHADELGASGGALLAAELQADSADHLVFVEPAAARAMAAAGPVATLLPAAAFYLKLGRFAPARMLIDTGVPVALATDVNPGGGFSPSMPFVMALACFAMGLTLEEALVAATINAAHAIRRDHAVGSLEPGKQLDAVVVRGPVTELLRPGAPVIHAVFKKGRAVHVSGSGGPIEEQP